METSTLSSRNPFLLNWPVLRTSSDAPVVDLVNPTQKIGHHRALKHGNDGIPTQLKAEHPRISAGIGYREPYELLSPPHIESSAFVGQNGDNNPRDKPQIPRVEHGLDSARGFFSFHVPCGRRSHPTRDSQHRRGCCMHSS